MPDEIGPSGDVQSSARPLSEERLTVMSTLLNKPATIDPQDEATAAALDEVFFRLREHMKPKGVAKAKAELEAYADQLETWQGCRLPPNVTPLRGPRSRMDQARASEAQRQERIQRAAALRAMIGRAF